MSEAEDIGNAVAGIVGIGDLRAIAIGCIDRFDQLSGRIIKSCILRTSRERGACFRDDLGGIVLYNLFTFEPIDRLSVAIEAVELHGFYFLLQPYRPFLHLFAGDHQVIVVVLRAAAQCCHTKAADQYRGSHARANEGMPVFHMVDIQIFL